MMLVKPTLLDFLRLTLNARDDEIEQYEALMGKEWDAERVAVEFFGKEGVSFMLAHDSTPVVAGGYDLIFPGVWHSWMIGTYDNWEKHWMSITKFSRRVMDDLLMGGARRLQTCVLESRTKTCEWYVRGLKMQYEGSWRNYGINGEAMAMYARIGSIHRKE
jgi:hypothetical protein